MASNSYNVYNYPYQQSSAQQYPSYPTAPATNNVSSSSRQTQQPSTSQAADYESYQAQSSGAQRGSYRAGQDNAWGGNNYGATRETTSRAAEVLRNMSNHSNSSTQSTHMANNPENCQSVPYGSTNSHSPRLHAQQMHGTHASYATSQPRPRSANTNRAQTSASMSLPAPAKAVAYPSQKPQSLYLEQQRSSPAQQQYNNSTARSVGSSSTPTSDNAVAPQYIMHDPKRAPGVDSSRLTQHATPSTSYGHANSQIVHPPGPIAPPASGGAGLYLDQSSTTVDPTAVYDAWPEYQRKVGAMRAQKAAEDAARAEEKRLAEEFRKAEEAKLEEERVREEERKSAEEAEKARSSTGLSNQQPNQAHQQNAVQAAPEALTGGAEALEAEIRAMMAKMRELNSKDPALLARIWEEERKTKTSPKPSAAQSKAAPQRTATSSTQAHVPEVANQRKKAVHKENTPISAAKVPTPAPAPATAAKPQVPAAALRPSGNTIWPADKKAQLASAAAEYLNSHNPHNQVDVNLILEMLDQNPPYIQLCEMLEQRFLKLDRAVFAKALLNAVPDVNSASRKAAPQAAPNPVRRPTVPPAIMKKEFATPSAVVAALSSSIATPATRSLQTTYPNNASPTTTVLVAEMVPIKAELKPPANKEEAARKRNLSELVDLTLLSEEENLGPPSKKLNVGANHPYRSPQPHSEDAMIVDSAPFKNNFPIANGSPHLSHESSPYLAPLPAALPNRSVVDPLDRKKALRRNNYNPATIARDVLFACGRHPSERQLNQHLHALRNNIPGFGIESDLSTIKWDLLDPGQPPPGYFKDSVQALTEDADDEEDSDDEEARPRAASNAIGGDSGAHSRVQALPEAINPFKHQKRRGRPPRHAYPNGELPSTPKRSSNTSTSMSAGVPGSSAGSVGYTAFRTATEYGPDGQPLPKKRGRPVGWRKAIHGSPAALAHSASQKSAGPQLSEPSSLRNVRTNENEPIQIDSRSPSVAKRVPEFQSYKCAWKGCSAELHNLDTLRKHVFKVHRKEVRNQVLDCLWDDCGRQVTSYDSNEGVAVEKHVPHSFDLESNWRSHIQVTHFDPLSWKLGDGPASGLSDAHDSEAYLSDAQGRRVTPRIRARSESAERDAPLVETSSIAPRGRGRPPKSKQEKAAQDAQDRLVQQKRRLGGPGMDRGGATLANDKRRRGLHDMSGTEEELVDVED